MNKTNNNLPEEIRHLIIGESYMNKRKYDLALGECNKALKINPNCEYAYSFLGHLYIRQMEYDLALKEFSKALKINAEFRDVHLGLGIVYSEQGQYKAAEKEFEKTLRFDSDNIPAHQLLGYVYKNLGKHDSAVGEFVKATNLRLSKENANKRVIDLAENRREDLIGNKNKHSAVKILRMPNFCNEEEIHSTELNSSLLPPLALGQISAYFRMNVVKLEQDDLNIKIHYDNYYARDQEKEIDTAIFFDEEKASRYIAGQLDKDIEAIMEKIERKTNLGGYAIILLSLPAMFSNSSGFMFTLSLARFIKHKYNPVLIVGGGRDSIGLLSQYNCRDIDCIVNGDGETIILEIILAIQQGMSVGEFLKSQYNEDSKYISAESCPPLKPDFSGLPINNYRYVGLNFDYDSGIREVVGEFNRSATLLLPFKFIKGCPHECIFCPESNNKTVYAIDPQITVTYLNELQEEYSPSGFFFLSDTLNMSRRYLNELCDGIIKLKKNILWTDSARADNLDKDTIFKMREAGCIRIVLGMETASCGLLKYIDKRISLRQLENTLKWADDAGIWTGLELICGLPHEKDEDIEETIEFLNRNKEYINTLYINQFALKTGSVLLKNAESFKISNVIELNQYANSEFNYFHKYGYDEIGGLPWQDKKEQILASQRKIMASSFWNVYFPVYEFEHFLFFLYSKFKDKRKIYEVFSKVAKEKNELVRALLRNGKSKN